MRKLRLNEIRRNAMLLAARRTSTAEEVLKYTVSGTVEDPAESAIEGVTVTVTGTSLTDDSAAVTGAFSIASVPKGGRTLTLTKADFQTKVVPVSVNGDVAVGAITFYQYFDIAGNIVDGAAAALESVAVTLYADAAKTTALAATTTDASGDYTFTGTATAGAANAEIIEGTYYVEAVLAGYTSDEDPLSVPVAADVSDADFVLTADA
jgi:hypothetical protein